MLPPHKETGKLQLLPVLGADTSRARAAPSGHRAHTDLQGETPIFGVFDKNIPPKQSVGNRTSPATGREALEGEVDFFFPCFSLSHPGSWLMMDQFILSIFQTAPKPSLLLGEPQLMR